MPVRHDTPETIYADLVRARRGAGRSARGRHVPGRAAGRHDAPRKSTQWLSASGFTRVQAEREVATPTGPAQAARRGGRPLPRRQREKVRVVEAIEAGAEARQRAAQRLRAAATNGRGRGARTIRWRFSTGLHCPESDLRYADPQPALFSFNSAYGACETCRGFGRVIGVDLGLVIPDDTQDAARRRDQDDPDAGLEGVPGRPDALRRRRPAFRATRRGTSSRDAQRDWVIDGSPNWNGKWNKQWYGVKRFFEYLESKAYKMHIRVLLSKYRSYTPCPACGGARLKTRGAAVAPRHARSDADAVLPPAKRFMPRGVDWTRAQLEALPGLTLHDLMLLPIERIRRFFDQHQHCRARLLDDALKLLLDEIRTRLNYLCDVGIGYLTLDRQSRTLSGGEVQRINLTTALGTSLVNTLFVLDEPSIGLHPRDMNRIVEAMQRLRDAGNTLVVVEHDPAVMLAADRLIDMGPGPGERGGQIVFDGTPEAIASGRHADRRVPRRAQAGRHGHPARWSVDDDAAADRSKARASTTCATSRSRFRCSGWSCVTGVIGLGQEHADAGRARTRRWRATSARRPRRRARTTRCSAPIG